jgi:hypothetical protein
VDFETPDWDAAFEFIPMGLTGRRSWPFRRTVRRQLIVSPFVDDHFLKEMAARSSHNILISRLESVMAASPAVLARFAPVYVLDPTAVPETAVDEETLSEAESQPLSPPSGLHAKLFISEYSYSTVELFTGSANATGAAFSKNVEFMVKFTGRGAEIGIDKLLVPASKTMARYACWTCCENLSLRQWRQNRTLSRLRWKGWPINGSDDWPGCLWWRC